MYKRSKETIKIKNKLYRERHPDYYKNWLLKNPDYFKIYLKKYMSKYNLNPDYIIKKSARALLNTQILAGNIIRADKCKKCKNKIKTQGHHEDYNKPLEVIWLCRKCHEEIHHNSM